MKMNSSARPHPFKKVDKKLTINFAWLSTTVSYFVLFTKLN